MGMAPKFEQLSTLTDQQIRDRYDRAAEDTAVGTAFYLDELRRRDYARMIKATNDLAQRAFWLGMVNGVFALVAAVAAIISLFGKESVSCWTQSIILS